MFSGAEVGSKKLKGSQTETVSVYEVTDSWTDRDRPPGCGASDYCNQ